jgi:VWFA-related protein
VPVLTLRSCTIALLAALLATWPAGVHGQAPQQPTFRSGVEVVLIDVNVVDKSAKPVDDLQAEDFTVNVDRKPRKIVSAVYINHGTATGLKTGGPTGDSQPVGLPGSGPGAPAPAPGRNVLVVVDEDSLDTGDGLVAKRAAGGFLDRLPASDRVGVLTIPRLKSAVKLSTDRADARKALDAVIAGRDAQDLGEYWIGLEEAYGIDRNDAGVVGEVVSRECKCQYPRGCSAECVQGVLAQAHRMAMTAKMRAQRSLDALRAMANGMRRLAGPKTVVLVSGGLPTPESTRSFSEIEQAFASAQITLYTLYIERMQYGQAKIARRPPNPFADDRLEGYGVENVTSAAGGTFIPIIGKVEPAFERVATEMAGSYLLGIEVTTSDRDGRPHLVAVKTSRPGWRSDRASSTSSSRRNGGNDGR